MIRTHPPRLSGRGPSSGQPRRGVSLVRGGALGLLDALARRPDGRDLLLLRGQRAERLGDQVRVRRDHVLPPRRVHHVRRVTPASGQGRTVQHLLYRVAIAIRSGESALIYLSTVNSQIRRSLELIL